MLQRAAKTASASSESVGATGRRYLFKELIQERRNLGRVWLATCEEKKFVLKDVPENIYSAFREGIWPRLRESSHVRLPLDTINIPDRRVLVYEYLDDDFLSLVIRKKKKKKKKKSKIPLRATKHVLKAALQGISTLHDSDVVHLDIKPDNVMVNWRQVGEDIEIKKVQITDLENAAYLPQGRCIKGMLPGNENWRSPEGHCKGELNKPSDIFSFGAVCIYAILGRVIFGPDDDFNKHEAQGALPALIRLQRQVSYFGDEEGLRGLVKHVGDQPVDREVLQMLWEDRNEDNIPYRPFAEWSDVGNVEFKSLIEGMMNLDPKNRLTAKQALKHPWFSSPSSPSI